MHEILSPVVAQDIVNRTMKILNKSINIRDHQGVIIASMNKNRINTVHKLSAKPIKEGRVIKVSEEEAEKIPGAQPGIDLPIYYKDKIVGAVGIIGKPSELEDYAGLVKMTVELMLQQSLYLKQLHFEEQAEEDFIKELLNNNSESPEYLLQDKANEIGFDINQRYLICLLEGKNFRKKIMKRKEKSSIKWQQYKNTIKSTTHKFFSRSPLSRVAYISDEKFVILMHDNLIKDINIINKFEKLIQYLIDKINFVCKISIGKPKKGLAGIRQSYEESKELLYLGKKLYPDKNIYHYEKLFLERLIKNISCKYRDKISCIFPLDDHYQKSLEVFFENDLNISKTARKLFLHRNTVIYRLNKIKEITGLNPRSFQDAICLNMALLSYKYNNPEE